MIFFVKKKNTPYKWCTAYTVRKEMKCSGDFEILHKLVRDNIYDSWKSMNHFVCYHEPIRAVSRNLDFSDTRWKLGEGLRD